MAPGPTRRMDAMMVSMPRAPVRGGRAASAIGPALPALSAYDAARVLARGFAVGERQSAVDDDVRHAGGILLRPFEGGVVLDGRGVEHDHIREVPGREPPAVPEPEIGRRQRSQPAHRFLQRNESLIADVT